MFLIWVQIFYTLIDETFKGIFLKQFKWMFWTFIQNGSLHFWTRSNNKKETSQTNLNNFIVGPDILKFIEIPY